MQKNRQTKDTRLQGRGVAQQKVRWVMMEFFPHPKKNRQNPIRPDGENVDWLWQ